MTAGTPGPLDAIVLDFDGLILDTELVEFRTLADLYARHGETLAFEEWQVTVGSVSPDWVGLLERRSGERLDRAETVRALVERQRALMAARGLLSGVEALIEAARARDVPVGVATGGRADRVLPDLRRKGLAERLGAVVTIDDCERSKPHAEPYLRAAEKLGARPERSVAFEDSAYGVAAAVAAGLRCVAVPSDITRTQDFSEAALVIDGLDRLDLGALFEGRLAERVDG